MLKNVRIWFSKTGTARYISHLDLNRCMSRAFHKAKLPLWYTEGFNPHVFLTFAAPLSLGFDGKRESMDVRLLEDMEEHVLLEKLNAGLPMDIRAWAVTEPVMKGNDIAYAEYVIRLETEDPAADQAVLQSLLNQPEIPVLKHGKKGDRTVDIKPFFEAMEFAEKENRLEMTVRLPAGNQGGINPSLFFEAAEKTFQREFFVHIERITLFDQNFCEFR